MSMVQAAKCIGAGCAVVSIAGSGVGIGVLFGAFVLAVSRNYLLTQTLFGYTMLGLALTEAIALFGLLFSIIILFT